MNKVGNDALLFRTMVYSILIIALLLIIIPFYYIVVSSFATAHEVFSRGFFLIPSEWTLDSYKYLMNSPNFVQAFNNAVLITAVGTSINMVMSGLMAYGLSKRWLIGRSSLNFMVLLTMIFSGGIIPTYLVVKELMLLDSFWALWLTSAIAPFNLIVMRSFFQNIPSELEEAATIDGCGELRLFVNIIVPLSMPVIMTFTLFYMVGNWNTYFSPILYLNDSSKMPLQVFLRQMLMVSSDATMDASEFQFGPPVKMAAVVITALPLLVIYPFLQKHFNKGMMLGSVKG